MSTQYRKRRLFPRQLGEVVKLATQPLMDKQGKLYSALLRDWAQIVGAERASYCRPQRLQWPTQEAAAAILHLEVSAARAPELAYETAQIVEQCAGYFGYRAIDRIVIHAVHGVFTPPKAAEKPPAPSEEKPDSTPRDMMEILHRLRQRIAGDDKP